MGRCGGNLHSPIGLGGPRGLPRGGFFSMACGQAINFWLKDTLRTFSSHLAGFADSVSDKSLLIQVARLANSLLVFLPEEFCLLACQLGCSDFKGAVCGSFSRFQASLLLSSCLIQIKTSSHCYFCTCAHIFQNLSYC